MRDAVLSYSRLVALCFVALCVLAVNAGCGSVSARAEANSKQAVEQAQKVAQRVDKVEGDMSTTMTSVSTLRTDIRTEMTTMRDGLAPRIDKLEGDMVTKQSWVTNSPWMVVGIVLSILLVMGGLVYTILRLFIVAPKERAINVLRGGINRVLASNDNNLEPEAWQKHLEQAKAAEKLIG
jgi:CHASE3 domain sensor protein